ALRPGQRDGRGGRRQRRGGPGRRRQWRRRRGRLPGPDDAGPQPPRGPQQARPRPDRPPDVRLGPGDPDGDLQAALTRSGRAGGVNPLFYATYRRPFMAREAILQPDGPGDERERDAALRPRWLREVIGQRAVVQRLAITLNACRKLKEPLGHI